MRMFQLTFFRTHFHFTTETNNNIQEQLTNRLAKEEKSRSQVKSVIILHLGTS